MAQYRFSAQVIKRSDGRSAVAAAAYRAGEKLVDERLEMPFDYRSRDGVEHTEIILPAGADPALAQRSALWNEAEKAERRVDAQVAREVQISLPHELSFEQRRELVRDFVQSAFVDRGMVADIAMHSPDKHGDDRNFHAHIMLTTRSVEEGGFGAKAREWNSRETLADWRRSWAETQNRHLTQALGPKAPQVSHKSLEDQGFDREATIHLGPTASAIERKGERSERGDTNREVQASNAERAQLRKDIRGDHDRHTQLSPQRETHMGMIKQEIAEYEASLRQQVRYLKMDRDAAAMRMTPVLKATEVRREIMSPARERLVEAERQYDRTRERTARIAAKRTTLASFIRNPQRAIWAKIREVHAMDRARRELARVRAELRVRQAWLRSDRGRAYVLNKVDRSAQAALPGKQQVRSYDRKIRRLDKRIRLVEQVKTRAQIAEDLGVKSVVRPIRTVDPVQLVRRVDATAMQAFSRASPQQLQQAQQQVRSLARGIGMGFSR